MKRTTFVSSSKLPDRTDDIKAATSRRSGHRAPTKEDHIRYYDLWHCPKCDEEVERMCPQHRKLYNVDRSENGFLEDMRHVECKLAKICLKCNVVFDWETMKELPEIVLDKIP